MQDKSFMNCTSRLCVLTNGLRGESLQTRIATLPALVTYGEGAVPHLLERIYVEDTETRWRICQVLGRVGGDEVVDVLVDILQHDEDENVRDNAAWALGGLGDLRAVDALRGALADKGEQTGALAANALARLGEAGAAVLQAALDSPQRKVRNAARAALTARRYARIFAEKDNHAG